MNFYYSVTVLFFTLIFVFACTKAEPTTEEIFAKMSPTLHLQEAKTIIENNQYIGSSPLSDAKSHLAAITPDKPEYASAQIMANQIKNIETKKMISAAQVMKKQADEQAEKEKYLPIWFDVMHAIDRVNNETSSNWTSVRERQLQNKYFALVANKHKLSMKELNAVITKGNKENWPMPEDAADRKRAAMSAPGREKRNAELGAELYKAGQERIKNQ